MAHFSHDIQHACWQIDPTTQLRIRSYRLDGRQRFSLRKFFARRGSGEEEAHYEASKSGIDLDEALLTPIIDALQGLRSSLAARSEDPDPQTPPIF